MVRLTLALSLCALALAGAVPPAAAPAPATPSPAETAPAVNEGPASKALPAFKTGAQPSTQTPADATSTPAPVTENAPVSTAASTPGAARITYSDCHVDGPYVAMTFDDGPHAENTPRLLDMLKQRGIKATFFVVGECAAQYPEIMKRIVAEGHEIGNHSWSHPLLSKMGEGAVTDQLQRTHDVIVQTTGVTPKIMRPPYGGFTVNQRSWANRKWGYKCILWDVDPLDWKFRNAEHVKSEILKSTVAGSIVLSHDIHKSTVDAMPATLDGLAAKGFKFVTVSALLAMDKPAAPKPKPTPKATPAPKVTADAKTKPAAGVKAATANSASARK